VIIYHFCACVQLSTLAVARLDTISHVAHPIELVVNTYARGALHSRDGQADGKSYRAGDKLDVFGARGRLLLRYDFLAEITIAEAEVVSRLGNIKNRQL